VAGLLFIALALVLLGPGLSLLKHATIGRRRADQRCWRCGFDVAGVRSVSRNCPECGTEIVAPGIRPAMPASERVRLLVLGGACLVPALHMGVGLLTGAVAIHRNDDGPNAGALTRAGNAAKAFARGGGSEGALRRAFEGAARTLSSKSSFVMFPDIESPIETHLIGSSYGHEGLGDIASALDDRDIPEARLTTLIDAWADAYEAHPVVQSTDADYMVASMLAGEWLEKNTSSDYKSRDPAPRLLTDEQRKRLVDMVLAVQRNPGRAWSQTLGRALEQAYGQGLVADADIRRYLNQSCDPIVRFHETGSLLQGDVVMFSVEPRWRLGTSMPVVMRVAAAGTQLKGRLTGSLFAGELNGVGWSGAYIRQAILCLPDTPGEHTLELQFEAAFGPEIVDALKASVNPWHHAAEEPTWKKMPPVRVVKPLAHKVHLQPSNAARTVAGETGVDKAALKASMRPRVEYDRDADGTLVKVEFGLQRPRPDVGFDLVLRQGDIEEPMGWAFAFRAGTPGLEFTPARSKIDPEKPVDLILRSSVGPMERSTWAPVIWSGEVTFENVTPRKAVIPAAILGSR
jgi:hypothetical protein